jgi:hypothetical protein
MRKSSRRSSFMVALLGMMLLFWYLIQPRVQRLHGADIVGLMACGACLGIGIAGLFGRFKVRNMRFARRARRRLRSVMLPPETARLRL